MMALGLLGGLLGLGLWSAPAQAEGKRLALVVGNAQYEELGPDQQLRNPVHDARTMTATLKALGYQVTEKLNLGRGDFYQEWETVLNQVTDEDTLLLFYSGHGVQIDGQNYLLPSDIPYLKHGRSLQVKRESISVSELLLDLRTGDRVPPKVTVMILDACRDDPLALNKSVGGGLASMLPQEGTLLMFSAAAGQTALDYLGPDDPVQNSVYTRTLVPLLRQPNLTLPEVARTVRLEVEALARTYRNHKQRPSYTDELSGRFCLAGCQTVVPNESEAPPSVAAVPVPALAPVDPAPIVKMTPGVREPEMVRIPGGTFTMGSNDYDSERPSHQVVIQDFLLGKYEVTFEEYDKFAQATGRTLPEDKGWGRGRRPVINVSWDEAQAYAEWLSKSTGKKYRLPTEAEWEYAARSGAKQETWAGTSKNDELGNYAVYGANSGNKTAEVGSKQPNTFGLHDLSGNVCEWVEDCWHKSYDNAPPTDGSAWLAAASGECGRRVVRGGSWYYNFPVTLRSSNRLRFTTDFRSIIVGFRLAQDIP